MKNIKYWIALNVILLLAVSIFLVGCSGCGGVKEKSIGKIASEDRILIEDKNAHTGDSILAVGKGEIGSLTSSLENFEVYNFDTLSKYKNLVDKVKIRIKEETTNSTTKPKEFYPLKGLSFFEENDVVIQEAFSVGAIEHYYNVSTGKEKQEQIHLTIYERSELLGINLTSYEIGGFSDVSNVATEFIFYDKNGNDVLHGIRNGEVSNVSISANRRYAVITAGGHYTEDTFVPYRFALYSIEQGEYIVDREFENDCAMGGFVDGTDWAQVNLMESCNNLTVGRTLFYNTKTSKWYLFDSSDCVNTVGYKVDQGGFVCHSKKLNKQIVINPASDFTLIESDFQEFLNQLK